jgi:hypothetical protein
MNYAVEMGSGAITCIPNFITTGLAIQKLMGDVQKYRHTNDLVIA